LYPNHTRKTVKIHIATFELRNHLIMMIKSPLDKIFNYKK